METSGVGDIGENDGFGGGAALPGAAAPHLRLGLGSKNTSFTLKDVNFCTWSSRIFAVITPKLKWTGHFIKKFYQKV